MQLEQFKALNAAKGKYWFSPDTMDFFGTRIHDWDGNTGLFITSEQPPHGDRRYSIRKADFETGDVATVGGFCAYKTLAAAKAGVRKVLREIKP
jgi:hypothetical protein